MIDPSPAQAAARIAALFDAKECKPGAKPRCAGYHIRKRKAAKSPLESVQCNHHG